jgi:hypothetical protein
MLSSTHDKYPWLEMQTLYPFSEKHRALFADGDERR